MKVFFTNSFLAGCYYVRCLIPMREAGWNGDRTSMRVERLLPEQQAKAVVDADVVVFHRPNDERSYQIAEMLKKQGKKIVIDNDDTYKGLDTLKLGRVFQQIDQNVDKFVRFADLVTCSTEFLAKEYRRLNDNVVVLPNCVDPEDWEEPEFNEGDKVRIGITGSVGLNGDTAGIRKTLETLSKREDIQLVLFSLPPKDASTVEKVQKMYEEEYAYWESLNVEWQPFVAQEDYEETLRGLHLDMMLIPRRDDYFNRCKSNLKFLEASMLEIPVIAQGFADGNSPYQDEEDQKYMTVVLHDDHWLPAIEELVNDKTKRREIGKKAHEYVLERYSIANNIEKWEDAYASLF